MKKSNTMISNTIKESVETEGDRRATGVSTNRTTIGALPDPEVAEKDLCRKFIASYKLRILSGSRYLYCTWSNGRTLETCEGLYSSNLTTWRRQRERGTLFVFCPNYVPHSRKTRRNKIKKKSIDSASVSQARTSRNG